MEAADGVRMPWTFAHPLAVLPLRKRLRQTPLFAAAVIGSLVPDFGYYSSDFAHAKNSHQWSGLFTHCLPIGLLLFAVWQLIRRPLIQLLPQPHRRILLACIPPSRYHLTVWLMSPLLIIIGAATHLFWDSFTHQTGDMVRLTPILQYSLGNIPYYQLLQYGSSLLGSIWLCVIYLRIWKSQSSNLLEKNQLSCIGLWITAATISLAWGVWHGWIWAEKFHGLLAIRVFTFRTLIHASSAACIIVVLTSITMLGVSRINQWCKPSP